MGSLITKGPVLSVSGSAVLVLLSCGVIVLGEQNCEFKNISVVPGSCSVPLEIDGQKYCRQGCHRYMADEFLCQPCPAKQFRATPNQCMNCTHCRECPLNEHVTRQCSQTKDTECSGDGDRRTTPAASTPKKTPTSDAPEPTASTDQGASTILLSTKSGRSASTQKAWAFPSFIVAVVIIVIVVLPIFICCCYLCYLSRKQGDDIDGPKKTNKEILQILADHLFRNCYGCTCPCKEDTGKKICNCCQVCNYTAVQVA